MVKSLLKGPMKIKAFTILVMILIFLMIIGININAFAGSNDPVVISLESKNINADGTVVIGVYARGIPEPGLFGYDFQITYNPQVVDYVYNTSEFPTFNEWEKGKIKVVNAQAAGQWGDRHLFDLSFKEITQTGGTPVTLQVYEFTGYSSLEDKFTEFPYTIVNGNISHQTTQPAVSGTVRAGESTISGTAENNATIKVKRGGITIGTGTASATGTYTVTLNAGVTLVANSVLSVTALSTGKSESPAVNVTVGTSPPVFQKITSDPSNKMLTLYFDKAILDNTGDQLRAAVTLARDGVTYSALGSNDTVVIRDKSLIISLEHAISGKSTKIRIAPQVLIDTENNVLLTAINASVSEFDECFIATAAYGSKFQPAVALLREFRNEYLLTNALGKSFVEFYYQNSPPIARLIAGNEILKFLIRILLTPIIILVYLIFHPVLLSLGLVLIIGFLRLRRNSILKTS